MPIKLTSTLEGDLIVEIIKVKADFLSWQKLLATIFFKRNQSSDTRSHGFGAKCLLKKLSTSDFSSEKKSALKPGLYISRKDRKHMVATIFFKLSGMSWSSHSCK